MKIHRLKNRFLTLLCPIIMLLTSCKKPIDYDQIDEDLIQQYITDNSLDAQPTGSGLYYVIDNPGNGSTADINSTVTVAYVGKLTDGTIFDQSSSMGTTFPLISVIQGWKEGIPLFRE